MNRIITGVLFSVAIAGVAAAAGTPATSGMKAAGAPAAATPDYAAQCKNLDAQWRSVEGTHKSDKKFAQAQSEATKAARNCESTKASAHKKGVSQYEEALKLLGVVPVP